ncbi:hypothetical protein HJFPF1_03332 [Paramyrothecium foliicola]|nr:hypothetical protein HJFPF1_03332 [Paramyrothecium foliicola]
MSRVSQWLNQYHERGLVHMDFKFGVSSDVRRVPAVDLGAETQNGKNRFWQHQAVFILQFYGWPPILSVVF